MNLVLFSGNSYRNRDYAYEVKSHAEDLFEYVYIQEYRHWKTGNQLIDIAYEEVAAGHKTAKLKPYIVFAKSIGTALTLKAIADGVLTPERCVFVGLPITSIAETQLPLNEWLSKVTMPITIIQNSHDPYGSYADVVQYLKNTDCIIIENPSDTHDYTDYQQIFQLLTA